MLDPAAHERFLGKTFVTRLSEVALQIGKDKWSRHQLADELGVGNYRAAALVTRALRKLQVKDIKEVFSWDPMALADVHQLGETGMYVLLRALEARGFNPQAWYHAKSSELVTFRTLKLRRQRERKPRTTRRKK